MSIYNLWITVFVTKVALDAKEVGIDVGQSSRDKSCAQAHRSVRQEKC